MRNFTREWQKVTFGLLVIAFFSNSTHDAVANDKSAAISKRALINIITSKHFVAWPITGKVTSATGEALPGVTVLVKGTTNGVTTGSDGSFSLTVPDQAGTLVISFIGFATKEIAFTKAGTYNITLADDAKTLEEVVVTGYTSEKKKDIIGSVSVVKTEELLATPTGNISSQLQGRAPGVTVSTSGEPGGSAKVRIRGFGSFGGSDPLYVIDGVPATSSGAGISSIIDNLNPNDIESVQVLKDAASASVYGARAANGVVIITTKKGKSGSAKITVDSYYATSFFNKFPDMLNTRELGEAYWKGLAGAGYKVGDAAWTHPQYGKGAEPVIPEYILVNLNGTRIGGADLEALRLSNPALFAQYVDPANYDFKNHQIVKSSDTNWFDEVFNPAPTQSYQLGASGGSEVGTYALS
ncbi:MAG: TonB-dependent receptor, partial [Adhaeribacter sp.]|nr:TonB-dependent receptor [Adhaeribacter sp.]